MCTNLCSSEGNLHQAWKMEEEQMLQADAPDQATSNQRLYSFANRMSLFQVKSSGSFPPPTWLGGTRCSTIPPGLREQSSSPLFPLEKATSASCSLQNLRFHDRAAQLQISNKLVDRRTRLADTSPCSYREKAERDAGAEKSLLRLCSISW